MNCEYVRLIYLADPREATPDSEAHLAECVDCRAFVTSIQPLQQQITQAMQVAVPGHLKTTMESIPELEAKAEADVPPSTSHTWMGYALAASLLLAVGLVGLNLGVSPQQPLTRLVYEHVGHENIRLASHDVSPKHIASEMQRFGMKMKVPGTVTFVERCPIGDTYGLHLVFKNQAHNITFIYLPEVEVDQPQGFAYDGMQGVIRSAPKGSLAIVGDEDLDLNQTETVLTKGIEWL